jgi:hypothetical protein
MGLVGTTHKYNEKIRFLKKISFLICIAHQKCVEAHGQAPDMLFVKHLRKGLLEKGLIYCKGQAERKKGAKNSGFIISVALSAEAILLRSRQRVGLISV